MEIEHFSTEIINQTLPSWSIIFRELSAIPLFDEIAEADIKAILLTSKVVSIKSNEYLFREEETHDSLYILLQGQLLITQSGLQKTEVLAEVSPVDIVGEIAFFTKNPRSASVIAIRDSVLIQLSREAILQNTQFMPFITNVAKVVTRRLVQSHTISSIYKRKVKVITLVPAGGFKRIVDFAHQFCEELKKHGTVYTCLSETFLKNHTKEQFIPLFHMNEHAYDYVVNVVEDRLTDITLMCINQTDHLLFVAEEHVDHECNAVEQFIYKEKKYIHKKELVIIRQSSIHPASLQDFLLHRAVDGFYNIGHTEEEYARLLRCVIGKNTCLVLSGGGGRGLAHLGTIKALSEKKVPIDMIAGTSMGSLIAAAYAKYLNYDDVYEAIAHFCFKYPFNRYTFPFVSIFNGQDFTDGFKEICGENTQIEHLYRRFLCVACNLTYPKLEVFKTGSLWYAVRASFAIPAVLPPVINHQGEILVDGCVMNNLPVDQMQLFNNGGKIIASQIIAPNTVHRYDFSDGIINGATFLLNKCNPFAKKINLPRITFLFMKSLLVSSQWHQQEMAKEADICIDHDIKRTGLLEFKDLDKIVEAGYQNALLQLENKWYLS